jgi:hypothetical protein
MKMALIENRKPMKCNIESVMKMAAGVMASKSKESENNNQ